MSEPVVIIGLRDVLRKLNYFRHDLGSRALMVEISEYVIFKIQTRTAAGEEVDGSPFKGYSPQYALFRASKQRPVDKVDLNFFGTMMSSITYDATDDETSIFFLNVSDREGTPVPLKAFFLNEQREFFGMSEDDIQFIRGMIKKRIKQLKRKR